MEQVGRMSLYFVTELVFCNWFKLFIALGSQLVLRHVCKLIHDPMRGRQDLRPWHGCIAILGGQGLRAERPIRLISVVRTQVVVIIALMASRQCIDRSTSLEARMNTISTALLACQNWEPRFVKPSISHGI